ncbi:MAG: molybdate ABC transporter permease subunit [Bacteroidota bacterium]
MNWQPFLISGQLALITTVLLSLVAVPLIFGLSTFQFRLKPLFKALVSLPLVLPPTVLGYYLLLAFRPDAWISTLIGTPLTFTFGGLVVGSMLYSLPFMVNPILSAVENLPVSLREAAYTLGKNPWQTYLRVMLPNVKPAILAGLVMTFAHTIGEFGVVLMIGGSIPGKTRVAAIAIYHEVEALNYAQADVYAGVLLLFSLAVLVPVYTLQQRRSFSEL